MWGPEDRGTLWEGACSAPHPGLAADRPLQRGRTLGLHLPPSPRLPWPAPGWVAFVHQWLTAPRRTGCQTLELETGSVSPAHPSSNKTGRGPGRSQVPNETLSTVRLDLGPTRPGLTGPLVLSLHAGREHHEFHAAVRECHLGLVRGEGGGVAEWLSPPLPPKKPQSCQEQPP